MHKEPKMSRLLRGPALLLCLILIFTALPMLAQVSHPGLGDGNVAQTQPLPVMTLQPKFHGVPWRDPNAAVGPVGFAAPAGAHLTYFGGPIISNVQVIEVLYGSGSYNSQVAGT